LIAPFGEAMVQVRGEFSTDIRLIFTNTLEQFFVYLKLSLFGGIILAFPVVAYQTYAFIAPGLYKRERATVLPYLIASPVLFALGAALVYFFVLPFVMRFGLRTEIGAVPFSLSEVEGVAELCPQLAALSADQARSLAGLLGAVCPGLSADDLTGLTANVSAALAEYGRQPRTELLPKVSEYLSLVTTLILAFGFSFQMPVVLSFAGRAGLVSAQQLRKGRKYAIVGIFAFAAFVTPPDPISQIILGIAIMGLYELSIWSVRLVEKRREEEEAAEAMAAGE
ncbi:MAG: twin-arginine translocase subunit TatC, partial [Maricaulaceae bacterium]